MALFFIQQKSVACDFILNNKNLFQWYYNF